MPYVIRDWQENFENAQSRKVANIHWVPLPNKHDGKGFRRIAADAKRCEIFTGWVLMVELASKMPTRGVLEDEDGELTCSDMSVMTGFPESMFETAIEALKDPKVRWIEYQNSRSGSALSEARSNAGSFSAEQNRTEGNRTEEKKIAASEPPPVVKKAKKSEKSRERWKEYVDAFCKKIAKEKGFPAPYKPNAKEIGQLAQVYDQHGPEVVLACWEMAWEREQPWSSWGAQNGRSIEWFCQPRALLTIMDDHRYKAKAERIRQSWGSDAKSLMAGIDSMVKTGV